MKTLKKTSQNNRQEITIAAEPGARRGYCGPVNTAYIAAKIVTDHATKHSAVDIGAKSARENQRQFCGSVNRLVKLLAREFPAASFMIRFLDSRASAKSATRKWDAYKQLAVQLTICDGSKIIRDIALESAYRGLIAHAEQTQWPHRGCGWMDGTTSVRVSKASAIMSVAARLIVATPSSVYLA